MYVWLWFLCEGFPQLWQAGATLHRGARASHYRGLSCRGAQAPDAQAQQLWLTGRVAPRHAGSSQTRARTRVPCIGRQILNHCATREAPNWLFLIGCSEKAYPRIVNLNWDLNVKSTSLGEEQSRSEETVSVKSSKVGMNLLCVSNQKEVVVAGVLWVREENGARWSWRCRWEPDHTQAIWGFKANDRICVFKRSLWLLWRMNWPWRYEETFTT